MVKRSPNKEQQSAIKHKKGPLLVIAGAGTGKTTVITERVKYLIEQKLAKPNEILALTFTEKASREMEERIDMALPYGYTNMWIMTFHSFCERVLRRDALQIGLDPRFKLMTTAETVQLIKNNLFKFKLNYFRPLGNPYKFVDGLLQHFSRLQDENISSEDYRKWSISIGKKRTKEKEEFEKYQELSNAYRTYEELKVHESLMDFGDLITKTIKLFKERPNVLRQFQKQFKYILIDEFQDTNYSQNELALLLASTKEKNITVVGDDDQSIYRFRGAAVSNIISFRKSYPNAKVVVLTKNYRSNQQILDSAYKLIQNNNPDRLEIVEKINKKLIAQRKGKGQVNFIHAKRVENEADLVVQKIIELSKSYKWKDFAILIRANNHAEPFIRSFQRQGVPYQFLGPGRLFRQPEIIDLISYLKVLYDIEDSTSFYRVLTLEEYKISGRDIAKLMSFARKLNLPLFEAAEKIEELSVSDDTKKKIKHIVNIITKQLDKVSRESAGQLLYDFLQSTDILANLINPDTVDAQKKALNISKFFDKLKTFEVDHPKANIFNIVDWIDLCMEVGESPLASDTDWAEINAVNILTIHSAKGLEFPVVFLINLVAQRFPTIERREQIPIPEELIKEILPEGDYHLQEERRLFYVGLTRAKDLLFLTAANFYGEAKREKKISPFVSETLENLKATEKTKEIKQLSFLDYSKNNSTKEKENLKINSLSYSQIEIFEICPLHFKLRYLFKIPTIASASQSLGVSIHQALNSFYKRIKEKEIKPTKNQLLSALK